MSLDFKKIASKEIQPKDFKLSKINLKKVSDILKRYPKSYPESAIMPVLTLVQEQNNGWVPRKALEYVSNILGVSEMRVLEIATFYSMYNLSPVGETHIEVCTTTPCMLRGSEKVLEKCKKVLNLDVGQITSDGKFSLIEVECLGACVNAPVIRVGDKYFEDLDSDIMEKILDKLENNKNISKGSQISRKGSEPIFKK